MEIIETERLALRPFRKSDASDCFEFLSDRETCYLDGGYPPFLEMDEHFDELMTRFATQDQRYMVELKQEHKVIGTIFLRKAYFRVVDSIEIGYCFSPNYRRKGYATEALNALFKKLFLNDHVELVSAKVYEKNIPSLQLLRSLGFHYEGQLMKSFRYPGREPESLECFCLLKEDYEKNNKV